MSAASSASAFLTSADPTAGGVITGHALIPPSSSGGSGGGSGSGSSTCVAGTYTKVPGGYTSCTAPSTLIGERAYVYDMSGQRFYWDHNGMWYLISDGGAPKVYTKTGPPTPAQARRNS